MSHRRASHTLSALGVIAGVAYATWFDVAARQAPGPRTIEVVATRYAFEPAVIEVTEKEPVRLLVRSGDGLHGFEIKKFNINKEIPRGAKPVVVDFTPDAPGAYPILCSAFCGDGHGDMKGTLVVVARAAAQ